MNYIVNFTGHFVFRNRQDLEDEGLVIGDDVGLRLKVMEFYKCSEAGLSSQNSDNDEQSDWEPLKIVIAESLPNISKDLSKKKMSV